MLETSRTYSDSESIGYLMENADQFLGTVFYVSDNINVGSSENQHFVAILMNVTADGYTRPAFVGFAVSRPYVDGLFDMVSIIDFYKVLNFRVTEFEYMADPVRILGSHFSEDANVRFKSRVQKNGGNFEISTVLNGSAVTLTTDWLHAVL